MPRNVIQLFALGGIVLGVVWAVVFFVAGFIIFWHGEERYGRD